MTMYRYMALMWSRTDREAARAAKFLAAKLHEVSPHAWSHAWDGAGLAIFHSGEHKGRMQTYRLQGERGAVLGRLFRKDYTSVVGDLDEFESRKCLETKGQRLIDDYWGRYVAFLSDPETGTRYVMRDPSGAFPCFHTPFRGVTIYFSDMQDAANFDFLPFTVNWDCVKSTILLTTRQKLHTGLTEVGEVLPAECVEVTPFEKKSRFVWDPTEVSQTDVVEDPEEAAALLRETVKSTVAALAGCYDRVVHNLGGLDSSIVLFCLADAANPPEVTCINYFTKSPRGEERFYSRQAAKKFGVRLVETELDYRKAALTEIFHSNKLAKPLGFFDCISLTGDVLALAKETESQALFYGVGGDNVFFQMPKNFGALDYVRRHGFGKHTLRVAMEASRYSRKSLYRTFCDMLRERISPVACYSYIDKLSSNYRRFPILNPEFTGAGGHEKFLHPLLVPADNMAKGKYSHISGSAFYSFDYYDHWDTDYYAERVHAYLTQPIIEISLRIPVWVLTYGGIDRGLARKAFHNDLPRDVIIRRSKSTPVEYYNDIYRHNVDLLREILLDGIMVSENILLRDRLENALSGAGAFLRFSPHEILSYLALEAWLRGWVERPVTSIRELEIAV